MGLVCWFQTRDTWRGSKVKLATGGFSHITQRKSTSRSFMRVRAGAAGAAHGPPRLLNITCGSILYQIRRRRGISLLYLPFTASTFLEPMTPRSPAKAPAHGEMSLWTAITILAL